MTPELCPNISTHYENSRRVFAMLITYDSFDYTGLSNFFGQRNKYPMITLIPNGYPNL